jgi:CRP-like cAMP-binding protein
MFSSDRVGPTEFNTEFNTDLLAILASDSQFVAQPFRRSQPIPLRPDDVWIVSRGIVLLNTLYASGDEALIGIAGAGIPFGLPLTLVNPYHAVALCSVEAYRLSMRDIDRSPRLGQALFAQTNRRLQQAEAMLALLGQRRVEERLKQFLQFLGDEIGQPTNQGTRITIRLTHQHLANALGTTRVTVTRLLNQLRHDNWLSIDPTRNIVIKDSSTRSPTHIPTQIPTIRAAS